MEMYNGSEQLVTETYMIPATGSNSHLSSTQSLEEIKYMGSEMAPEFVFDQGLYYPSAGHYYGYYCTGFDSPGECDDHHRFFGVDGQELHYLGLQTESLPYVYYTPNFGYAQSPYNPYNPYIPGAVIGHDSMLVGTQQYLTTPSYQPHVPSPTYFPVVVQSSSDILPISSSDSSLLETGAPVVNRPKTASVNYIPSGTSLLSASAAATSKRVASKNPKSEPSQSSSPQIHSMVEGSRGSLSDFVVVKQPPSRGAATPESVSQVTQGRTPSSLTHATDQSAYGRDSSAQNPLKFPVPVSNGFASFRSRARGWAPVDKFRPGFQHSGVLNNVNGSPDALGEQNKGPRTNRLKGSWTSAIDVRAYTTKAGAVNSQGNIVIFIDQYNRDDFPIDYPEAKFFIIKSYSEDDVHKSIKYNVWSSTPNGNKRLDNAYADAQRISVGKPRKCPVFLFFSVNASGQFCGVAEMNGPVDFNRDMDFWQQDKWSGSFPVKWHIVKDVPNTIFRHILLENNENKPVTNSRDTQEITYLPGMTMLSVFKNSPLRTSILDDFMFYEERQRIMYEEKCRLLGRNYDNISFPVVAPSETQEQIPNSNVEAVNGLVEHPLNTTKKFLTATSECKQVLADQRRQYDDKQPNIKADQNVKADGGHLSVTMDQPLEAYDKRSNVMVYQFMKEDGKQANPKANLSSHQNDIQPVHEVKRPLKADRKEMNGAVNQPQGAVGNQPKGLVDQPTEIGGNTTQPCDPRISVKVGSYEKQVTQELDTTNSSLLSRPDPVEVANGVGSIVKIGSLSIDAKIGEESCADALLADVVTVGSVHIKVNMLNESSGILTVGSIPIDPKGVKPKTTDINVA